MDVATTTTRLRHARDRVRKAFEAYEHELYQAFELDTDNEFDYKVSLAEVRAARRVLWLEKD